MMPFPPTWVPFRLNLWFAARLMTIYAKRRPLGDLLRRAEPDGGKRAFCERPAETIVDAVKASVARPWRMRGRRCLREGLLCFYYLSLAGYSPVLYFGIVAKTASGPHPRAHCWLVLNGQTILNAPVEPMVELFSFNGAAVPASAGQKLGSGLEYA